jgi:phage protein D
MTVAEAIPIYQGQDFYVPTFEVKLRERPVGQDVIRDILQVTYKDNIEEIDSFDITINNWDAATRDFKYSNDDLFDPGKQLELWMGYHGKDHLRRMIVGEITALRPSFPSAGQPTLVISGLNLLHRFRGEQVSDVYTKLTDSQIAKRIGARLKPKVNVETAPLNEEAYDYLIQDSVYDIVFLMDRARRVGYDLYVDEGGQKGKPNESVLHFGPSDRVRRVTYKLTYGRSLIEFQPTLDTSSQVGEVIVRGWDAVNKKAIIGRARRSDLRTKGVGSRGGQDKLEEAFKDRKEIVATQPIASKSEADRIARETLERIAKGMLKATGSTVGLPDLRAGNVVEIDGLDRRTSTRQRFNGRYFVTSTTHSIGDGGYTVQFECRREEI